ncbi:lim domain-containing protein [Diplodia corticola]|uniref:Lim domain-containing protein n=1 Tax=Diplodia corticola TaxID=236234 RepID=A0A1J9QNW7_9PEZI|nr:lim domain-containing protein [Diplodia corticola]OJD29746.1 lim domain-containing protein [Diplodia corticola]
MADTARPISILPSIKCSDCSVEIEISKMADHVCAPVAEPELMAPPKATKNFFDRAASSIRSSTAHLKPGRSGPPPSIDSSVANKPFVGRAQATQDPLTPNSNPSSRSPSPAFLMSSTAFRTQPGLEPRAYSPTSPDQSTIDRANSPDPIKRQLTPTHDYPESDPNFAPLSPRPNASDNVFSRLNTLASGPFNVRERKTSLRPETAEEARPNSSHKRTPTLSSLRSRSKSRTSSRGSNVMGHERQPSVASTERSRSSMRSNGLPAPAETGGKRAPPPRPARPNETVDAFLEKLQGEANQPSLAGLMSMRSQIVPIQKDSTGNANKAAISLPRRPSEKVPPPPPKSLARNISHSSTEETPEWWDSPDNARPSSPAKPTSEPNPHGRKPSVADENAKRYPRRTSSRNISLKDLDLGPKPPVPQPPRLEVRPRGTSHAPSDSGSSEASSGYDYRSSRSTPPTSAGASPINEPFKPYRPFDQTPAAPRPGTSSGPPPEAHGKTPSTSMSRQNAPESLPLDPPQLRAIPDAPESPMDPAIQRGMFTPSRPSDSSALPEIQSVVRDEEKPPMPPTPTEEEAPIRPLQHTRTGSSGRRPGTAGKGNCRGCGEVIVGKSVKAADGRLTGRWHKQCFVCRTCHSPFQTADFYVIENHPYCGHHYHQMNGSLCRGCNYGIEGQYLETERRQKFHPQCFACDTCRMPLRDDYFDVMGVVYCERHAWHAARQTGGGPRGMLAPGDPRRNPERRRTRLMMM